MSIKKIDICERNISRAWIGPHYWNHGIINLKNRIDKMSEQSLYILTIIGTYGLF